MRFLIFLLLIASARAAPESARPPLGGTFIQLNRAAAAQSADEWGRALDRAKALGIDTLLVQWTAEGDIAYFKSDAWPAREKLPALGTLLAAAGARNMSVFLGLENDSTYWTQITARDRVLRDYFLTRVARAERLQQALLKEFGREAAWKGYYIPDEIDDLNWRSDARRALIRDYVRLQTRRLRERDPGRLVAVSAFMRSRTAPDVFAGLLRDITVAGKDPVDVVLVQDGVGVGDPSLRYVGLYFEALRKSWPADGPGLWGILETFDQTSKPGEPFAARPAAADRVRGQFEALAPHVDRLVLFTLLDYAEPSRGGAAAELYDGLRALK